MNIKGSFISVLRAMKCEQRGLKLIMHETSKKVLVCLLYYEKSKKCYLSGFNKVLTIGSRGVIIIAKFTK